MDVDGIDVIGLGASTMDLITHVAEFPARRETRQALGMAIQGGGPVATAMVTLARLGGRTAMVDSIGDDWAGVRVLDEFQAEGVDTRFLEICSGYTTSISNILISAGDGARAILFVRGSVPELSLSAKQKSAIRSAKILHLNGRHWQACLEAANLAKTHQVRISFDGGADRYRQELKSLVPMTDICIVAKDFAEKYTGEKDPARACACILGEGPEIAVVTAGDQGSWVCTHAGIHFHQPAFLLPKIVDTTGCGDSYHGAFLFGLLKGYQVEKTAALASAVAALNTQHLGGRSGVPNFAQAAAFLSERGVSLG
jgi:sugar/nucleoside kinase (ribokinase family)